MRRPDPGLCASCAHYGEKDRSQSRGAGRREFVRQAPSSTKLECLWFNTPAGRAASVDERMSVISASVNGGAGCAEREQIT